MGTFLDPKDILHREVCLLSAAEVDSKSIFINLVDGLPPESLVANKEGFISGSVVADAGFILSPKPWIMVVIVNDMDDSESYQIIRVLATRSYEVINPKKPSG